MEPTVIETRDDAVVTLTLSRPAALNAITPGMLVELGDALAAVAADRSVRAVVLTGEGRAFSSGVDLKSLDGAPLPGGAVGDLLDVPARRVIELAYFEQYTQSEIALALDIPLGTVKTRTSRGLQRMAGLLESTRNPR